MANKRKFAFSEFIDEKISFDRYNEKSNSNNSENLKNKCKILNLIIKQELTDKQREILNMYYFHNLNIPQISKKTGKNKSTISRSLKRAREKIKNYMQYNDFRQ